MWASSRRFSRNCCWTCLIWTACMRPRYGASERAASSRSATSWASGVAVSSAATSFSSRTLRMRSRSSRFKGSGWEPTSEDPDVGHPICAASARRRAAASLAAWAAGAAGRKAGFAGGDGIGMRGGRGSDRGLAELLGGFQDGLGAPGQAVDLALAARSGAGFLRVALVEGVVDAAQDRFQRDAGLTPGFNQRPVQRGEHQDGAAALLEAGLDLREIVEIVHKASCQAGRRTTSSSISESNPWGAAVSGFGGPSGGLHFAVGICRRLERQCLG